MKLADVASDALWHISLFVWMNCGQAYFKHGKRGNSQQPATARPLHFDWQCHICKRVMNHKTRVKGKLTQQLTGDWYIELEVFNLAAELTWSLYNKLQCLQGNTSPDGSPFCFSVFSPSPSPPMRDLVDSLEYRLQVLCSLNMIKMDGVSCATKL